MNKKEYETIIVGAGISGLSCARRLHDVGKDFLVISKDIGGRMGPLGTSIIDNNVAYVYDDSKQVLKYARKIEPLRLTDYHYLTDGEYKSLFSLKNIQRLLKIIKLYFMVRKLWCHFLKYREQAPYKSIKECFEGDPVLLKYWKMPAKELIKKHGLEEIDEIFGNPISAATGFTESKNLNALYYLGFFVCCVTKTWIIDLKSLVINMSEGYEEQIKIGTVLKVSKNKNASYRVRSSAGDFIAKNVVFAAPQKSLKGVYDLPKPHLQQPVHVFYVKGIRKDIYQNKRTIVFRPRNNIFMIWGQKTGIDIVYSKNEPNLDKYYTEYQVVTEVYWNPAMILPKNYFIEQKLDKNLYLASDYNISILEDSFLTGLYAANQIIKGD
jgi:hypothetical protein